MIRGIGIDLCEVSRMEEAVSHPAFYRRVLSENERAYLEKRGKRMGESAAGLFAAKEAFLKALGTGIHSLALSDVEIDHDGLGAPYYRLSSGQLVAMQLKGAKTAFLSITHDGGMAAAVCVLEGDP